MTRALGGGQVWTARGLLAGAAMGYFAAYVMGKHQTCYTHAQWFQSLQTAVE
jgi:xanthine/uracil permease